MLLDLHFESSGRLSALWTWAGPDPVRWDNCSAKLPTICHWLREPATGARSAARLLVEGGGVLAALGE
jgi:hypothetical protein